jgi:DNA-binding MarR family transcriptional regulator
MLAPNTNPVCLRAAKDCLGLSIRKTARAVAQAYDEALAPCGLRGTQFSLLNATALMQQAPISQLAAALGMDRSTLSRNLKPLQERGLINVAPGADKRQREVSLTTRGQNALLKALPLWQKIQSRFERKYGAVQLLRVRAQLLEISRLAQRR